MPGFNLGSLNTMSSFNLKRSIKEIMKEYNFKEIEKKWQDRWKQEKSFQAIDFHPTKPKYYVLYEFFNRHW